MTDMTGARHFTSVQFKALGDFVIAANCIARRKADPAIRVDLLLGEHLRILYDTLGMTIPFETLAHGENGVPALISLWEKGAVRGLRSAIGLKRALYRAKIADDAVLLFDKLDKRERFLAAGFRHAVLPRADNIYLAYDAFLDGLGLELADSVSDGTTPGPLRIYPGARLPERHVPIEVIRSMLAVAAARGVEAELMLLEGERPDLEASNLPYTRVTRDFGSLIASIRGAGKVVSADSMPAHLSEYLGRPVFVSWPEIKTYWLPRSAFAGGWSCLFGESGTSTRFTEFLDEPLEGAV